MYEGWGVTGFKNTLKLKFAFCSSGKTFSQNPFYAECSFFFRNWQAGFRAGTCDIFSLHWIQTSHASCNEKQFVELKKHNKGNLNSLLTCGLESIIFPKSHCFILLICSANPDEWQIENVIWHWGIIHLLETEHSAFQWMEVSRPRKMDDGGVSMLSLDC